MSGAGGGQAEDTGELLSAGKTEPIAKFLPVPTFSILTLGAEGLDVSLALRSAERERTSPH